jgi:muramoyltetrapeptide carboxypeptidase
MMPVNYLADHAKGPSADSLHKALFGERLEYQIPGNIHNREGKANGVLVGGNLSILYSLNGTSSDMDTTGKVLFLEDLDEYLYHIDRMVMNLKRSGKLENLAGLLVGGMTKMRDNEVPYGKTAEEIIREAVEAYDYPVCFGFPAGHAEDNRALILGRSVSMEVSEVVKLKI